MNQIRAAVKDNEQLLFSTESNELSTDATPSNYYSNLETNIKECQTALNYFLTDRISTSNEPCQETETCSSESNNEDE